MNTFFRQSPFRRMKNNDDDNDDEHDPDVVGDAEWSKSHLQTKDVGCLICLCVWGDLESDVLEVVNQKFKSL